HSPLVGGPNWSQMLANGLLRSAGSHSRTMWSALAVASSRPSGLNATPFTVSVWPVSGARTNRGRRATLDYLLLGWIAARGTDDTLPPDTREYSFSTLPFGRRLTLCPKSHWTR